MIALVTPPDLSVDAVEHFTAHGCIVYLCRTCAIVVLPGGAKREPIYPRTLLERFVIVLPDGYRMGEVYDRFQERSLLSYRKE